ncbi:MAG: DNA topoisomerase VI subunit B [Phycisphaerales bacterium]|nr:MAG: DNA topoisomerase VI subunit B [Phycisphaerales bacterium]
MDAVLERTTTKKDGSMAKRAAGRGTKSKSRDLDTDSPSPDAGQRKPSRGSTAEQMALKQRDISVSEFFAKNRHLLGFDNPRKALLTTVKEAVDNSLDACEEAGILPHITVVIEDLEDAPATSNDATSKKKTGPSKSGRYRVTIVDNGPGIVRKQVENIFGRLLYGSKFHRLKMSRGQQGIGISAAGMYGLITTGKPMVIHTKPKKSAAAHHIELAMNTKTNRAEVTVDVETDDFPPRRLRSLTKGTKELAALGEMLGDDDHETGTSVSLELEGKYQKGRGSVDEFLELTAIANPHARIVFVPPSKESAPDEEDELITRSSAKKDDSEPDADSPVTASIPTTIETTETGGVTVFPRAIHELPPETKEIQPHPKGVELGILIQMLREAEIEKPGTTLYTVLQDKFSRVSPAAAGSLCKAIGVTSRTKVGDIDSALAEKLYREFQDAKFPPPPTDCLAPIGVRQLLAGLLKGVKAEFYAASSREAAIYRGRPFLIEAAIGFGGDLLADDSARVIRFANRVPLLYQQSACSSFKAVVETNWKNYDLQQPRTAAPVGPLVVMVHMASVWVPFTSESKEAIADYDEIRKEMKLALMECGRKLGTYLKKRAKMKRESMRRDVFERYIGEIAKAVEAINGTDAKNLYDALLAQAKKHTAIADQELDDEGRIVKARMDDAPDDDGVIIVDRGEYKDSQNQRRVVDSDSTPSNPLESSKAERARLKVASLAKADDDELFETKPSRGASPSGRAEKPTRNSKSTPPSTDPKSKSASKPGPTTVKSTTKAAPASPTSKSEPKPKAGSGNKLRMRLVNGKLVRVDNDGPALF